MNLKIKAGAPLLEIINGVVSLRNLREVRMEDLLGREAVSLNFGPIEEYTRGKTVLITGAAARWTGSSAHALRLGRRMQENV